MALRQPQNLPAAVGYLLKWLRGEASSQQNGHGLGQGRHTEDTLNYLRGGSSAFTTAPVHVHFQSIYWNKDIDTTADYRNAIARIYALLRNHAHDATFDDGSSLAEADNLYHNNVRINIDVGPV